MVALIAGFLPSLAKQRILCRAWRTFVVLYRVNAGRVPREHWVHDAEEGGGRIIARSVTFVDLMHYWIEAPPVSVLPKQSRAVVMIS